MNVTHILYEMYSIAANSFTGSEGIAVTSANKNNEVASANAFSLGTNDTSDLNKNKAVDRIAGLLYFNNALIDSKYLHFLNNLPKKIVA
jgi:hypothetical protein